MGAHCILLVYFRGAFLAFLLLIYVLFTYQKIKKGIKADPKGVSFGIRRLGKASFTQVSTIRLDKRKGELGKKKISILLIRLFLANGVEDLLPRESLWK